MSLVGTLAKVALGVAAAKGIGHVIGRATQSTSTSATGQATGGIGSLLEQLAPKASGAGSGTTASAPSGGLDDLIRGLAGAASGTAAAGTASKAPGGSFADVLNQSFEHHTEPKILPTPQQDAVAGLMLRAMLQAAKCDGRIDEGEKKKILGVLGDASREDMAFVNKELSSPVDVPALVKQVPKGLENQIYAASVMGIDLDSEPEAQYLATLASALGMGSREANAIHAKLGIPARFG
jgi:uncharacterized membrane protein YebE (DUF533 family)